MGARTGLIGIAVAAAMVPQLAVAETHAFCGRGDALFCGLLADCARRVGAHVHFHWQAPLVAADLVRRRPRSIKLVGQSQGCEAANEVAQLIRPYGGLAARYVCFDGATVFGAASAVPGNVLRGKSFRQDIGLGGARLVARHVSEETVTGLGLNGHVTIAAHRCEAAIRFLSR